MRRSPGRPRSARHLAAGRVPGVVGDQVVAGRHRQIRAKRCRQRRSRAAGRSAAGGWPASQWGRGGSASEPGREETSRSQADARGRCYQDGDTPDPQDRFATHRSGGCVRCREFGSSLPLGRAVAWIVDEASCLYQPSTDVRPPLCCCRPEVRSDFARLRVWRTPLHGLYLVAHPSYAMGSATLFTKLVLGGGGGGLLCPQDYGVVLTLCRVSITSMLRRDAQSTFVWLQPCQLHSPRYPQAHLVFELSPLFMGWYRIGPRTLDSKQ